MMDTALMKARPTVIRGGLVLDANGHASLQDILIEDGSIAAIENPGFAVSGDAEVIPASDRLLIPGLIAALIGAHLYLVAKLGTTAPPWLKAEKARDLSQEEI